VIRSLFFEMHHAYGVKEVLGFRWGYQGLDPQYGAEPLVLTHEMVDRIHLQAGTILGASRGPVDKARAVENLIRRRRMRSRRGVRSAIASRPLLQRTGFPFASPES
jgi:6-phosphofructokinase 1